LSSTSLKDKIAVTVDITNAGSVAGKEVVQLYIHAPKGQLDKPSAELKAFAKTKNLAPGEKQTISFEIKAGDLASFDTEKSAWIAEAGQYKVMISASSTEVKQQQSFTVKTNIVTEKCNKVLAPKVAITELKAK
jgi:beta-glucosidase